MILGAVDDRRRAVISLQVAGPAGVIDVPAVIDTGFTGTLTLPASTATSLGVTPEFRGTAFLADGSEVEYDVYPVQIGWGDVRLGVFASGVGDEALVGMTLLDGHELRIEVRPGGAVEVRPLP